MPNPLPSATPTWHNNTYEAISPHKAELSAAGKTVVIIGAGSGIGRATAKAFVDAQASKIILLGRRVAELEATASSLGAESTAKIVLHATDVTQQDSLKNVAASIGTWDILVTCAGYVSTPATISSADEQEWWQSFETNVKGTFLTSKAFLPTANKDKACFLVVTTGSVCLPPVMVPGNSGYISSKLAQVKMVEYLAAENPDLFTATIHPGLVDTYLFRRSGAKAEALPMDQVELPAHFLVWMASPEAAFLKGRLVWANWDVEELKAQAQSIGEGLQMTSGINGWPYPNM